MSTHTLRLFLVVTLLWAAPGLAPAAESLIHDGDRWVCLGDSITAANIYPPVLERVFAHYHPEASFKVINSGVGGDTASDDPKKLDERVLQHQPTIVSVMYGMNEAINVWKQGDPKAPIQDRYRKNLTYIAHTLKQRGITVLLLSPTLSDPTCGSSYFRLEGTVPFLKECAAIVREVAAKEGVTYIPMQETLAAFDQTQPSGTVLRSDGVHPSALGQYEMARLLWESAYFAGPLGHGARTIHGPVPAVPARLALASRFVDPSATGLTLTAHAPEDLNVTATWNLGELHRQETLNLKAGDTPWKLEIPNEKLPSRDGQNSQLFVDLRTKKGDSLYIIDLCRTRVLHFANDVVTGTIESEKDRPEGKRMATWQVQRVEGGLLFSGEVFDSELNSNYVWPWGRDGFNLQFDFRPTERFANIGVDGDVYQTLLNVYEKPFFSVAVRPWTGLNMGLAATASGSKTATGYTTQFYIKENFGLHTPFTLDGRDFVGIMVAVNDLDSNPERPGSTLLNITGMQRNDENVGHYANNLMVLDLQNKLPGDAVINAHLYSAKP